MNEEPLRYAIISFVMAFIFILVVTSILMVFVHYFILQHIFGENAFLAMVITWGIIMTIWTVYIFNAHIREKDVNDYCVYLNTSGASRDKNGKKISYIDPVCPDCHGSGKMKNGRFYLTTCNCISRNVDASIKRNRIKIK